MTQQDLKRIAALDPLTAVPNWVVWRWKVTRDKYGTERKTKVPYCPQQPTRKASSKNAATWADYSTARAAAEAANASGIGFCLYGTEFAAFDLDDCRNAVSGEIAPWAQELVKRVDSYTEVTISGTGLRIIGRSSGPKIHRKQKVEAGGSLETYRGAERYIVMTGEVLPAAPLKLADIGHHVNEVVAGLDAKVDNGTRAAPEQGEALTTAYHDDLEDIIQAGCGKRFEGDRSNAVWFVINELLRRGHYEAYVERVLLNRDNRISDHVYDQAAPQNYVRRQIKKAIEKIELTAGEGGRPSPSQENIRVALLKLGVRVRHDGFADRTLIVGLQNFGPTIDDPAVDRLWLLTEQRFRFRPSKDIFYTVLIDTARLNGFHPVRDY